MIFKVLKYAIPLLLPFVLYYLWIFIERRRKAAGGWEGAPLDGGLPSGMLTLRRPAIVRGPWPSGDLRVPTGTFLAGEYNVSSVEMGFRSAELIN